MRSEQEMLELIINTAKDDDRIRAIIMNGSRVNPNVHPDIFQDFDIIYIVTDIEFYKTNYTWINKFGELMIMQMPDGMGEYPLPSNVDQITYLMQFKDGNRIDLKILTISRYRELKKDSLSLLLLDKDGIIEPFPAPNENSYLPKPPTANEFYECCNEFWWVCPYVAKGLWRQEITYAKSMLDQAVREQLMKMIIWQIGVNSNFTIYPGKNGKYFSKYLESDYWEMLLTTYANANINHTWQAMLTMCNLFRIIALNIANNYGFKYPQDEDENVTTYVNYIRELPATAEEIY